MCDADARPCGYVSRLYEYPSQKQNSSLRQSFLDHDNTAEIVFYFIDLRRNVKSLVRYFNDVFKKELKQSRASGVCNPHSISQEYINRKYLQPDIKNVDITLC